MNAIVKNSEERLMKVLVAPVISEKATFVAEKHEQVVFLVTPDATKLEIKAAVELLFKVKVQAVRTANFFGKERRRGKFSGYRPDWKKAYVRLEDGQKMPDYLNSI